MATLSEDVFDRMPRDAGKQNSPYTRPMINIVMNRSDWAILLLLATAFVALLQVFCRYVLGDALAWPEEAAKYLFVWFVFLGAAMVTRRGQHITIDLLRRSLPPALLPWHAAFTRGVSAAASAFLLVFGWQLTARATFVSPALEWPHTYLYLAVPVGATVEFPNLDPFFHNVFSYSKTKRFDLGRYPAGNSESVTFDKPGIVSIFCEIHYSMRAYVHVLDTPYFAVSDDERHFEIDDVEPGEYVLHVWQENLPEIQRPLSVRDEPLKLEVQ